MVHTETAVFHHHFGEFIVVLKAEYVWHTFDSLPDVFLLDDHLVELASDWLDLLIRDRILHRFSYVVVLKSFLRSLGLCIF